MTKKEDLMRTNIVLNTIFYNKMKCIKDKFTTEKYSVKRMRQFDNNYWKLVYILQRRLFDEKKTPFKVEAHSKYGAELHYDNLLHITGFRGEVFKELMDFFDEQDVVKALRSENGGRSYTPGGGKYSAKATIYYIPLQIVVEMQKCDTNCGYAGECIEVEFSKKNVFFNKELREQKQRELEEQMLKDNKPVRIINGVEIYHNQPLLPWIEEEMNSPYKDFKKWPSDWEQIDIIRISDIEYDEEMFLQIAKKNNIQNPVEYLERCKSSAMRTKLSHGRVVRYGWNHLKKYLREAVIYHGQQVDVGADYHNADFRMLVILAWMKRELYKINKKQLEDFEADVKFGIYKLMNQWTNYKYGEDKVKELMLTFKNATNDSKRWFTDFRQSDLEAMKEIKNELLKHYPDLTKGLFMSYKEIKDEGKVKNCLSVHCQNIEGYLMHQFVLPVLEEKFEDPFTMCDAVFIRKSLTTEKNKKYIESVLEEQFDNLIECVKHNNFIDNEQREQFKHLIQNLK